MTVDAQALCYRIDMLGRPDPVFQTTQEIVVWGKVAIYSSQADVLQGVPQQWRSFLIDHPKLRESTTLYGASPCTADRKIHYLTGVAQGSQEFAGDGETLTLQAGEYAVVLVRDVTKLRETWTWLLGTWLATSGRHERNAPEFERYTGVSDEGEPVGAVEIWIPLEPMDARV